ncbi:hypothetical protein MPH_11703 [Macrophomina phaseolina MS6]|uniref:Uncharacterized protein n=1 Tax=Macrophomina phaseolina (strain MS6) TaxID=1126212 RepID=K2RE93_MACPH|nr:hypothetical protein MPH_11703 [Macrophomina phaseolina MS6]
MPSTNQGITSYAEMSLTFQCVLLHGRWRAGNPLDARGFSGHFIIWLLQVSLCGMRIGTSDCHRGSVVNKVLGRSWCESCGLFPYTPFLQTLLYFFVVGLWMLRGYFPFLAFCLCDIKLRTTTSTSGPALRALLPPEK